MMTQIFESYSALWCHAATQDEKKVCEQIQEEFRKTSDWWHQFAAHEVSNVEATDSVEVFKAAEHVAQAMNLWQKEGGETGNVAFWSKHAHLFATPRSYELIVNALFDKNDLSTSRKSHEFAQHVQVLQRFICPSKSVVLQGLFTNLERPLFYDEMK